MSRRDMFLVAALALLVQVNTLNNPFVIDARAEILQNRFLPEAGGLKKLFTTPFSAYLGPQAAEPLFYRPIPFAVLWVEWQFFHDDPRGYRAVNIVLHAAVAVLVYACLRRISGNQGVSLIAACLFAVHPMAIEAVEWTVGFDLQQAVAFLLGLLLYTYAGELDHASLRYKGAAAGIGLCFGTAVLCKEIALVLPVLFLVYEWGVRRASPFQALRRNAAVYSAMAATFAAGLLLRRVALGGWFVTAGNYLVMSSRVVAGWFALLFAYTVRLAVPVDQNSFSVVPMPNGWWDARVIGGIAIVVAAIPLAAWLWRRRAAEFLAVPWALMILALALPGTIHQGFFWLGERHLYMPLIAVCWLLAAALNALPKRRLVFAAAAVLVVGLGARTVLRNRDWHDELGFYTHELQTEPDSLPLRPLLTEACIRRGMPEQALTHAEAMARLAPADPRSHNFLGFVQAALGRRSEAESEYLLAARYAAQQGQNAFAARALNNAAVSYSEAGEFDRALPVFQECVRLDPEFPEGEASFGFALLAAGRPQEARAHLQRAVELDPANSQASAALRRLPPPVATR